jgi:hypothetical protein
VRASPHSVPRPGRALGDGSSAERLLGAALSAAAPAPGLEVAVAGGGAGGEALGPCTLDSAKPPLFALPEGDDGDEAPPLDGLAAAPHPARTIIEARSNQIFFRSIVFALRSPEQRGVVDRSYTLSVGLFRPTKAGVILDTCAGGARWGRVLSAS